MVIPSRKSWLALPFLSVWLVGWAFGEVSVVSALLRGPPAPGALFMVVWLTLWTLGGAAALATLAWGIAGREVIIAGAGVLAVRREVLGVGRSREYAATHVRNLRVAPAAFDPFDVRSSLRFWGLGGGLIAFDHGARTVRFGAGVEEAEAADLLQALRERLPSA